MRKLIVVLTSVMLWRHLFGSGPRRIARRLWRRTFIGRWRISWRAGLTAAVRSPAAGHDRVTAAVRSPADSPAALEEATAAAMPAVLTDGLGAVTEADTTGEAGLGASASDLITTPGTTEPVTTPIITAIALLRL